MSYRYAIIGMLVVMTMACKHADYADLINDLESNSDLLYFKNHSVGYLRNSQYMVDALILSITAEDTIVHVPSNNLGNAHYTYIGQANRVLDGEERRYYIDVFKRYQSLSVHSIVGMPSDGLIKFTTRHDDHLLFIHDSSLFDRPSFEQKRGITQIEMISDKWYVY